MKIAKVIFRLLPNENPYLMLFSERYLDRALGDNNCNPEENGEELILRAILPSLKGGVIFDVGSNVGDWTAFALSVERSLKFELFEPSTTAYKLSKIKLENKQININNFGLGSEEGVCSLHMVSPESGMNSLYFRKGIEGVNFAMTETVKISTIDDYCLANNISRVDYLKIDVEGHELSVLKGASSLLNNKNIKFIQYEYGGCNLDSKTYFLDIWDILTNNGYKIYKIFPRGLKLINNYNQKLENFKYSNYLAVSNQSSIKNLTISCD
jgi:FkbM family methyltransferase